MAALGLKPRRQIRQPLRGGVNEHGLHALVETSEDESTDKNEKHAKRRLHGMAYRQGLLVPALRVAPDYADAMFNLALLLQRTNQYAEAADYWRRYLGSDCQSEWASRARRSLKFCEMQVHLSASA
jgi:predicted metal-dependent hydrolase